MRVVVLGPACWLLLCAAAASAEPADPALTRGSWLFDAGGDDSELADGAVRLGVAPAYDPQRGFGWVEPPQESFVRQEWARSRDSLAIDGVAGRELEFRADVPPGRWWLTVWLEAAPQAGRWPAVSVNGEPLELGWQPFRPNSEPFVGRHRLYRVIHQPVECPAEGLSLRLAGEAPVRLLGLSLLRDKPLGGEADEEIAQALANVGRFDSKVPLGPIIQRIEQSASRDTEDTWLQLQLRRCLLLQSAEELFAARGWRWADVEFGMGMFDRQYQAIALLDGLLGGASKDQGALSGRARFLRGRALYWLDRERGGDAERAGAERDLAVLSRLHPEDQLLAMYRGERVALPCPCDGYGPDVQETYEAPQWSWMQLEALCRMRRIAHWWTLHRQSDTGEFGGKLGDDVELLRWWAPLCLSGDRVALRGWRRLADGVWNSGKIDRGYAAKLSDVEHAAELIADTAPLMVVYRDEPLYQDRLSGSVELFRDLWTSHTKQGRRFFRSAWFSSTEIDAEGRRGRDVEYNTRAAQAIRYLAWRRPDAEAIELLHEWATAWAHAAMRTDKGKPKGVAPASVRFSDECINGDGPSWHEADMYWHYYDWDTYCGSLILDQLLFAYQATGDELLLQPMHHCLALVQSEATQSDEALKPGSAAWAATRLSRHKTFWRVVEQWRFCTGDTRWDELIRRYGSPYGRYRLTGNEEHLHAGLEAVLENLRFNTPLMTTEALYTDRVGVRGWELLKAMLTGDGVTNNISPHLWVSWERTDEHFTALVADAGEGRLKLELFSHSAEPVEAVARLWKPVPGEYRMTLRGAGSAAVVSKHDLGELGQRIRIALPSRRLVTVELESVR